MLLHRETTDAIIAAAIEVHRALGPGLLEAVYEQCLRCELEQRARVVRSQVDLPVRYKGILLECGYRIDLVVDEVVVVEIKSIESILPVHEAQLMTYLRLSGLRVGLLINFNVPVLKDGIVRRIL